MSSSGKSRQSHEEKKEEKKNRYVSESESESDHDKHSKHSKHSKNSKHSKHSNHIKHIEIEVEVESSDSSSSSSSEQKPRRNSRKSCNDSDMNESKRPNRSRSCSRSRTESDSDSESDSETECERKCKFDDLYQYYKFKLLTDETLMVRGSDAYVYATDTVAAIIPQEQSVDLQNVFTNFNVDAAYHGSPFHVRRAGVYNLYYTITTDESAQMCVFVNGVAQVSSRCGNNSGGGQLLCKTLLRLNKDDAIVIRNDHSTTLSLTSGLSVGGTQLGNPSTFTLFKIASYDEPMVVKDCLSKKRCMLYNKLEQKLVADCDLMMKGFDVHASLYTNIAQNVPLESDFVWDLSLNVNKMWFTSSQPDRVTIMEDGIYKIYFLADVVRACQVAVCVNGVPVESTTQGVNKGSSQLTIWALLELKKDDYVTVRNHSSANGSISVFENAGGPKNSCVAQLQLFKISTLYKNITVPSPCALKKYNEKCYLRFRNFLLKEECLQLYGSPNYTFNVSDTLQVIPLNADIDWSIIDLQKKVMHRQGFSTFTILKSGVYNLVSDIITNEPHQLTMHTNGVADDTTVTGRNSGSARSIMKQFLKFKAGDTFTIKNDQSYAGNITTSTNSGGHSVGVNRKLVLYYLAEN
jgi:hypothetical protein